jgi:hypothetical protein
VISGLLDEESDDIEVKHDFTNRPRIIVAIVAKFTKGIDLFCKNHNIFLEHRNNLSLEHQAAKRQHSTGRTRMPLAVTDTMENRLNQSDI